jgi:hypothetical protein
VVDEQSTFDEWLDSCIQPIKNYLIRRSRMQLPAKITSVCSACHGMQGENNVALNAPAWLDRKAGI